MSIPLNVPLALPWDIGKKERRDGVVVAKRSRTRFVLRVERAGPEWGEFAGRPLYVKRYLNPFLRRKLGSLLGISKARSEAAASEAVRGLGIVTPQVVGYWTTWRASYIATVAMEGLLPLGDALAALPAGDPRREGLWRAAGRFTAMLWRRGVWHPDYFEDHLCLVRPVDDVARLGSSTDDRETKAASRSVSEAPLVADFALLDVDGVCVSDRSANLASMLHSAAQMLKSCPEAGNRTERLAFLAEAFGATADEVNSTLLPKLLTVARKGELVTGLE